MNSTRSRSVDPARWPSAVVDRALDLLTSPVRQRDFEALVRNHYRAVLIYARSMTSSDAAAEDATQDAFLRAWRYLDSFRGSGSFEGWLIRICRRCIHDQAPSGGRPASLSTEDGMVVGRRVVTGGEGPTEMLMVLRTLSIEHREVLVLCGLLGYDYETAAAVLDLAVGTVKSRLHRARAVLATALGDESATKDSA